MSQPDNTTQTHSPAYAAAILMSGLSSVLSLIEGQFALALLLAGFTILLVLSRLGKLLSPKITQRLNQFGATSKANESPEASTPRKLSIILSILTLAILWASPRQSGIWIYTLPLMLMFFFEFRVAVPILIATSLLSVGLIAWHDSPLVYVQAVPNYVLFLGAACALVYLRELRRRQLKPLRRTDNLSDAASRQHLDQDLEKEIQRSEREGSDVSLIAISLDDSTTQTFTNKDHDLAQIEIGKLLHNNLRIFDSYYRLEQHHFLVVLPHTNSKQAVKIADSLRIKIKQQVRLGGTNVTTSMGIASLNVGDDSLSLLQNARTALEKSRQRGGDQSYLIHERDLKAHASAESSDED
jgi:diguanylate cyclase (GGDEF)-like protein